MKFSVTGKSGGKQHCQISFGIPLKLIRPLEAAAYQWKKFVFWLNPFHCDLCGARQYVRQPEYELVFENGRRLRVSNHGNTRVDGEYNPYCICRLCLADQLEKGLWKPRFSHDHELREGAPSKYNYRYWRTKVCDVTGEKVHAYKDVEIFPYVDMIFCTIAWNYGHVSKDAVIRCVLEGEVCTTVWGIHKKKMSMTNSKGLFIDSNGDLL